MNQHSGHLKICRLRELEEQRAGSCAVRVRKAASPPAGAAREWSPSSQEANVLSVLRNTIEKPVTGY